MGTLRTLSRKLKQKNVWFAKKISKERNEILKSLVEERVKTDYEFAQDVLKAVGNDLPENIKKAAEETVKNGPAQINNQNQ